MNEIFSDNKTISHKLALLIKGRKGGYPLKLMDALFQEGSRRQQKRKIRYQQFASFIPYFVDDSEEENRDAYC